MEIRTYEGGPAELAALCDQVWHGDLLGKSLVPIWDEPFFAWQVLAERPGGREYLLSAYDGGALVGMLMAEPFTFRIKRPGDERDVPAAIGSFLTVAPDYRPRGLGIQLIETLRERLRERGAAFCLGFVFGGKRSGAYRFWNAYGEAFPAALHNLGGVGFWVRVLDPEAVSRWTFLPHERWFARLSASFVAPPRVEAVPGGSVRDYRSSDLPACLALTRGLLDGVDLGYVWTPERLALQLEYRGTPRTHVVERGGRVVGLLNWYPVGAHGNELVHIGSIDLIAMRDLTWREARDLLDVALAAMRERGCAAAVTGRLPACRPGPLLRAGFAPLPADTFAYAVMADEGLSLRGLRRFHIHPR